MHEGTCDGSSLLVGLCLASLVTVATATVITHGVDAAHGVEYVTWA